MKKIIAVLMTMLLVFALPACGQGGGTSSAQSEPTTEQAVNEGTPAESTDGGTPEAKKLRFAWINPTIGHPVYTIQDEGALMAAEDYGVELDILGESTSSPELYAAQIEIAITEKYDGIIVAPYSPGAMTEALQRAIDAGIPVVNTMMESTPDLRLATFVLPEKEIAIMMADNLARAIGGKGEVACTQTNFEIPLQNRIKDYFIEYVEANYPDMKVVTTEQLTVDTMVATERMQNMFTAYPDIVGVVVIDATGHISGAKVAQELNRDIKFIGLDDLEETLSLIRDGHIDGTIAQNLKGMAYESVRVLYEYVTEGVEPPDTIDIPLMYVSKDNVDTYFEEMFALTRFKGVDWPW